MLCDTCNRIPYRLFIEAGVFQHGTLYEIRKSAEAGCGFCALIDDSFNLQRRRGKARRLVNVINEFVTLCHSSAMLPMLDLLYKDDISRTDGAPLWYDVLLGSEGYKQAPTEGDSWEHLLQLVRYWESKCRQEHPTCAEKLGKSPDFLPTRLIDIGLGQDESLAPRLVLTSDLEKKSARYITLSHRWGPPELMASTTRANLEDRLSSIQHLPLTFRQAADIAKRLDIPYLWIDSLCIVQDDADDKGQEIAMMAGIYSNSFCNIAASAASDPTQGCCNPAGLENVAAFPMCFPTAEDGLSRKVLVRHADRTQDELSSGSESGTLSGRGWILQERQLPERAVVFTPRCVVWECRVERAARDYPNLENVFGSKEAANPTKLFSSPFMQAPRRNRLDFGEVIHREIDNPLINYHAWHKLAAEYSEKKLTVPADRLPAIGGLARKMQELTGDEYVAGLWKRDLVRQLCWMQPDGQQLDGSEGYEIRDPQDLDLRKRFRAPTWSWAYMDIKVYYPEFDKTDNDLCRHFTSPASPDVVGTSIKHAGPDSFGPVSFGSSVTLRGKMITVSEFIRRDFVVLPLRNPVYQQETLKRVRVFNRVGQPAGLIVLDRQNWMFGLGSHSRMVMECLRMWSFEEKSVNVMEDDWEHWPCRLIGLALRRVMKNPDRYERLGVVYFLPDVGEGLFRAEDADREVTII